MERSHKGKADRSTLTAMVGAELRLRGSGGAALGEPPGVGSRQGSRRNAGGEGAARKASGQAGADSSARSERGSALGIAAPTAGTYKNACTGSRLPQSKPLKRAHGLHNVFKPIPAAGELWRT